MAAQPSQSMEAIFDRFEEGWRIGREPPRLEDFLPPSQSPDRRAVLVELVKIDMERRLKRGERVRFEEMYLPRFAELESDEESLLDLLVHEYKLRRGEPGLSADEYWERWPRLFSALLKRLPTMNEDPKETPSDQEGPGSANLHPGVSLGDYDLGAELGSGGMGVVFRAVNRLMGRECAVKVLPSETAGQPQAIERFRREMAAIGRVEHPNLVSATHAGESDGRLYLVMELLDGSDLEDLTRRHGRLPPGEACEAVRQAALGLQHAHERGLVHRDIKPSNLFLTRAGVVKVLDLGLAAIRDPKQKLLTRAGSAMGTPAYMPPEQALDSGSVDIRADIYSLGGALYYLLTGRLPHDPMRATVPAELAAVLDRMMAPQACDRFATPAEAAAALEPFARGACLTVLLPEEQTFGRSVEAPSLPAPRPATPAKLPRAAANDSVAPSERPARRRRVLAAMIGLTILAGSAFAAWRQFGWPSPSTQSAAPPALTVRTLRVLCYRDAGRNDEDLGELGNKMFHTDFGDKVTVEVELSEPAYSYLLAFNPATEAANLVQLCPRADENRPPEPRTRWTYPAGKRYRLNDGPGLQAFAVIASRQLLPAYSEWRRQAPAFPWKQARATSGFVWRGDAERLYPPLKKADDVRGEEVAAPEEEVLEGLRRQLHSAPGIEAIGLIAFAVDP